MATAVFFHAHPDDEAIATGGTMRAFSDAGHRVVLVVATAGEQGEPVAGVLAADEALGVRRRIEAEQAGEILGAHRVVFLGYRDSGMMGEPTNDDPACFWQADVDEAVERMAAVLGEEKADLVTIYDDNGGYGHPDHIQVHRVGLAAARRVGVTRIFQSTMNRDAVKASMDAVIAAGTADDELVERRRQLDDEEGSFGKPAAAITHGIDVSAQLDVKRQALGAHASQISEESFFLARDDDAFRSAFGTEHYIQWQATESGPPFATDLFVDR